MKRVINFFKNESVQGLALALILTSPITMGIIYYVGEITKVSYVSED